jgi:hypothetical protein
LTAGILAAARDACSIKDIVSSRDASSSQNTGRDTINSRKGVNETSVAENN